MRAEENQCGVFQLCAAVTGVGLPSGRVRCGSGHSAGRSQTSRIWLPACRPSPAQTRRPGRPAIRAASRRQALRRRHAGHRDAGRQTDLGRAGRFRRDDPGQSCRSRRGAESGRSFAPQGRNWGHRWCRQSGDGPAGAPRCGGRKGGRYTSPGQARKAGAGRWISSCAAGWATWPNQSPAARKRATRAGGVRPDGPASAQVSQGQCCEARQAEGDEEGVCCGKLACPARRLRPTGSAGQAWRRQGPCRPGRARARHRRATAPAPEGPGGWRRQGRTRLTGRGRMAG